MIGFSLGALILTARAVTSAVPAGAVDGAGTSIGNAAVLAGTATGSLSSATADDWYVIYPSSPGGPVGLTITDTTVSGSTNCPDIGLAVDNADGADGVIHSGSLGVSGSVSYTLSSGSSWYYVEVDDGNCVPTPGDTTAYSLDVTSGGGGTPPSPSASTIAAGTSIGTVGSPLQGGTLDKGSIAGASTDAWYVLDKANDTNSATIRIEDTTVLGSTNCPSLGLAVDNANGTAGGVDSGSLGDNGAVTYTITAGGMYYIELEDGNCTPTGGEGGPTYSIEPEPGAEWTAGPTPPAAGTTVAGTSIGTVGSPLQGGTIYKGSIAGASTDAWYVLDKANDTNAATIRIEDTTVRGSTNCPDLGLSVDNANGTDGALHSGTLGDDGAVTYTITDGGMYYIELEDGNCIPTGGEGGPTYSIEPEPGAEWTAGPTPPAAGTTVAGTSIGTVGSPLQGGTIYKGSIAGASTDAWYVLDKANDANSATIRIEDTTVLGSTNCPSLGLAVDNANGTAGGVDSGSLADNGAVTYTITAGGMYYIELDDGNCTPTGGEGGPTYSIEPEPGAEWTAGPNPPVLGTIAAGTSIGTVGAPMPLGTIEKGSIAGASVQAWYVLDSSANTEPATIRIEDTTIRGSTNCPDLSLEVDNANGTSGVIHSGTLGDNAAVTYTITEAGTYYIEVDDGNCTPTGSAGGPSYSVEYETSLPTVLPESPFPILLGALAVVVIGAALFVSDRRRRVRPTT